jgi:hypothetical protein
MKYLRKFNEQEKSIEEWCKEFSIENYEIVKGLVNVNGEVIMSELELSQIPINFGIVTGYFDCSANILTSLDGCPIEVEDMFNCGYNKLTTLINAPNKVNSSFSCDDNELISLEGCPVKIYGHFTCRYNKLTSLSGGPADVYYNYNCSYNEITSLEGAPVEVGGYFCCNNNELKTLNGLPKVIGGFFDCSRNYINEVYKLFATLRKFKSSLEYEYLDGANIIKYKFKEACEELGVKMPDSIPGYEYI